MFSQDDTFALKLNKSLCPMIRVLSLCTRLWHYFCKFIWHFRIIPEPQIKPIRRRHAHLVFQKQRRPNHPSNLFLVFFWFFLFFFFSALRQLFTGFRWRFGSAKYQKKSQKKCQKDLHKNISSYSNSTPFSVTWCKIGSVQTSDLLLFSIFSYPASRFRTF